MSTARIITLTTDFGLRDPYVGAMKGVILSVAPDVTIVDITHDIAPQNIAEARFVLAGAVPYFPDDAIHVAVVDPGVGTIRRAVAIAGPHGTLVGPDNGIFSIVLESFPPTFAEADTFHPPRAVELTNKKYHRHPVSRTFHGRDIFAPVAAHLAQGAPLSDLGSPVDPVIEAPMPRPEIQSGCVRAAVIHIDRFGNSILNVRAHQLPASPILEVRGTRINGLSMSYEDALVIALEGSTGLVEIAVRDGSAAALLCLAVGDPVIIEGEQ